MTYTIICCQQDNHLPPESSLGKYWERRWQKTLFNLGVKMKHLTLVILLALAPASFSAEQSLPSFKCTIDYTGGVTHRHGSPRVANFKVGPDNEFRLVHRSRLSESVQTELDRFHGKAVVTDHSGRIDGYQTTINDYVVRFASKDPAIWYS